MGQAIQVNQAGDFGCQYGSHLSRVFLNDIGVPDHSGSMDDPVDFAIPGSNLSDQCLCFLVVGSISPDEDDFGARIIQCPDPEGLFFAQNGSAGQYQFALGLPGEVPRKYHSQTAGTAGDKINATFLQKQNGVGA